MNLKWLDFTLGTYMHFSLLFTMQKVTNQKTANVTETTSDEVKK